jgi:hypothetical protein
MDPPTRRRRTCGELRFVAVMPIEDGVTIEADRQVLAAAVGNLLQNAFKFTRPRTTVTLRVCADAERVRIEIEDECGGIPGENLNELFRPFEQRSTDRTGLDLASPSAERASKRTVAGFMRATDTIADASSPSICRGSQFPSLRRFSLADWSLVLRG